MSRRRPTGPRRARDTKSGSGMAVVGQCRPHPGEGASDRPSDSRRYFAGVELLLQPGALGELWPPVGLRGHHVHSRHKTVVVRNDQVSSLPPGSSRLRSGSGAMRTVELRIAAAGSPSRPPEFLVGIDPDWSQSWSWSRGSVAIVENRRATRPENQRERAASSGLVAATASAVRRHLICVASEGSESCR